MFKYLSHFVFGMMSVLIFESAWGAGPVVIGNGGDVHEENPVSVTYLQSLLPDARLFIVGWLNGLESQIKPNYWGLREKYTQNRPVPTGADKLFRNDPNIFRKIDDMTIVFNAKSACASDDGFRDGSVISTEPAQICISGFKLAKKLNEGNAKIQLEALILHEISHLAGASEAEATALQIQYLNDMKYVPKEMIMEDYDDSSEALYYFESITLPKMMETSKDYSQLCKSVYDSRLLLANVGKGTSVTPLRIFSTTQRDSLDDLGILIGNVLHLYICAQDPLHPVPRWLEEYQKGFAGKERIEVKEWLRNSGTKGIRETTTQLRIWQIKSEGDLLSELRTAQQLASIAVIRLVETYNSRFNVKINEK